MIISSGGGTRKLACKFAHKLCKNILRIAVELWVSALNRKMHTEPYSGSFVIIIWYVSYFFPSFILYKSREEGAYR
jgi:hypothetical protein